MWYNGGDNKNGESKLAKKAAFNSDFNFNLYEYFHFCSKMLKKEDTKPIARGRSSNSPCMIVFCSFEQLSTLIAAAKKHGFVNYIPLVFCKNYSPQVLKANMRIVGATEYALVLYRNKLPKFRNGLQIDENGKNIRGTCGTFSMNKICGNSPLRSLISVKILSTSHNKPLLVPLPLLIPSCFPATDRSVQGKEYVII
jgi:hypothetical protein